MEKNKSLVIVLGAGQAKRMGHPKGLFKFQDKELINWHMELCQNLNLDFVVILNPSNKILYSKIIPDKNIIINDLEDSGPKSSIMLGLEYGIRNLFENYFILPIDTLPLKEETLQEMEKIADDLVIPSFQMRSGHPPKLSKNMAQLFLNDYQIIDRLDIFFKNQKKTFCVVDDAHILSNQNYGP